MRLLRNFIIGLFLVICAIAAMLLIPSPQPPAAKPWEVIIMPDGNSKVLGIHLANTTYKAAQEKLGIFGKTAIFTEPDKDASVEAYFDSVNLGGLSAKLVLNLAVPKEQMSAMLARASGGKLQPSGAYQHELAEADRIALLDVAVNAITYIPSVRLDETMLETRFGEPDKSELTIEADGSKVNSWYYSEPNLTVLFSDQQKTLLIYSAKSMFPALSD